MLLEYYFILIYFFLSVIFALVLFLISFLGMSRSGDSEKYSAYECGFNPFEDTRSQFDVRFYLVGILFIIFDLEITFLFPWCLNFLNIGFFGFFSMYVFLFILVIGFYYEWTKGALDW